MAITVGRVGACILCLEGELSSCVLGTGVTRRLCIPKHIVHRRHCARHSAPSVLGLGLSHVEYDGDICNSPQSTEEHPPDPCLGTPDSTVLHVCTSRVGENNFMNIVLVRSDLAFCSISTPVPISKLALFYWRNHQPEYMVIGHCCVCSACLPVALSRFLPRRVKKSGVLFKDKIKSILYTTSKEK